MFFLLLACADSSLTSGKSESAADPADSGSTTGADTGQSDDAPPPAWWTAGATVSLVGGAPDPATASTVFYFVAADTETPSCEVEVASDGLVAGSPPDPAIAVWWTLPALDPLDDPCGWMPGSLGLGIGSLGAETRARLGDVDMEDEAAQLYGAYLQFDGGDPYAIGYAQAATATDAAAEVPPDDNFSLVPLFLLALP